MQGRMSRSDRRNKVHALRAAAIGDQKAAGEALVAATGRGFVADLVRSMDFSPPGPDRPMKWFEEQLGMECDNVLRTTVHTIVHARRAGWLLWEVKKRLPHGQFLPWVRTHFRGSLSTANNYANIARRWEELRSKCETRAVNELPMRLALSMLADDGEAVERWSSKLHHKEAREERKHRPVCCLLCGHEWRTKSKRPRFEKTKKVVAPRAQRTHDGAILEGKRRDAPETRNAGCNRPGSGPYALAAQSRA